MSDIVNTQVATDFQKVLMNYERALLERIDEYRWTHRIESRAEAIRILIEGALARAEKADGTKPHKSGRGVTRSPKSD